MVNIRVFGLFFGAILLTSLLASSVSAVTCWSYDGNETGCNEHSNECTWMADEWAEGGGWCEQKGCWNFWNESTYTSAANMSCTWKNGSSGVESGWCEDKGCWLYDDNQTECEAHTSSLGFQWDNMSTSDPGDDYCYKKGCWEYSTENNCTSATDYKVNPCQPSSGKEHKTE